MALPLNNTNSQNELPATLFGSLAQYDHEFRSVTLLSVNNKTFNKLKQIKNENNILNIHDGCYRHNSHIRPNIYT
jgi:hypothetical protein